MSVKELILLMIKYFKESNKLLLMDENIQERQIHISMKMTMNLILNVKVLLVILMKVINTDAMNTRMTLIWMKTIEKIVHGF